MTIIANGYVWQNLGSSSQFYAITYHHIATGYRYLMVNDAASSYFDVVTTDDAIRTMWQEWWCSEFCSSIQVSSK